MSAGQPPAGYHWRYSTFCPEPPGSKFGWHISVYVNWRGDKWASRKWGKR